MRIKAYKSLLLIKTPRACLAGLSLVCSIKKGILASITTIKSFGHCNGRVSSFDKVTKSLIKSFLFFLLIRLTNLLGLKLLEL